MDYQHGNFSVSQCSWASATSSIVSIISPEYFSTSNTTSVPPTTKAATTSKHMSAGIIAAVVLIPLIAVAGILGLVLVFIRRRKRSISPAPTEADTTLTRVESKSVSLEEACGTSAPEFKQQPAHEFYGFFGPPPPTDLRTELPDSNLEVHQLPDGDNREEGDYLTAARSLKLAITPEVAGSFPVFELPGCDPAFAYLDDESTRFGTRFSPVEMDDERSRNGLSPVELDDEQSRGTITPIERHGEVTSHFGLSQVCSPMTPIESPVIPLVFMNRMRGNRDTTMASPRVPSPMSEAGELAFSTPTSAERSFYYQD